VPIFDDGQYRGTLLAVYSLNGLLKQQVPWWFAEKYQVRIVDGNGNLLASKSRIDASPRRSATRSASIPPATAWCCRSPPTVAPTTWHRP
jgi:hypothetical protein